MGRSQGPASLVLPLLFLPTAFPARPSHLCVLPGSHTPAISLLSQNSARWAGCSPHPPALYPQLLPVAPAQASENSQVFRHSFFFFWLRKLRFGISAKVKAIVISPEINIKFLKINQSYSGILCFCLAQYI